MTDVFISYGRSSAPLARAAAAALRAQGYEVWFDDDLPTHRAYGEVIEERIDAAKAVLALWSTEAARSHWVRSEADRAREAGKLVQVTLDGARPPMPFDQIQCADLSGWSGEVGHPAWVRVAASVAELVGAAPSEKPAPAPPARVSSQGERRHLTALSCRLIHASRGELDPEHWRDIAARFQRLAADAVIAFGGHVAKVQGETLTAYFGWPQAREDAGERAVRAGLAIVEATAGLAPMGVRVGIHAGLVVVAPGGAAEIDMFGDAPRVAADIEAAAGAGEVLFSNAVMDLVAGLFVVEARGEGDEAPLWRATGESFAGRRSRGYSAGADTPFVGRDEDLAVLAGRWTRAREGEGQVVLLTGEAGIGKTRLIEEFSRRLGDAPHLWIECAGAALCAATPFYAVTQLLEHALGLAGGEAAAARRLDSAIPAAVARREETVALIGELVGLSGSGAPPDLAPEEKRSRLLAALTTWVFAASNAQPLVVAVEDLQWVDPSTLELLGVLAAQGATAPLLLLLTARAGFQPPWSSRGHHAHVTLGRLSNRQARDLVATAAASLSPALVERVVERADGVPLFAEELSRLMAEGGGGERDIPATLLDSLAARLDRLGRARDTAQLGAVIGREFTYALIQAISPAGEDSLRADLAQLADAELVYARGTPPEAAYRFKHALVQDAAYAALLKSDRRALHAKVARALADAGEAPPEALARHWTLAGEAEPAIVAWQAAGEAAYGRSAYKEAEEAYRQALAVLAGEPESVERDARELQLTGAYSRVLQLTQGYSAAATVAAAARAKTLAEKSGALSQLIREEARLWAAAITAGDYAGASALADHVLELSSGEAATPPRMAFAHNAQVQSRFYTGDLAAVEIHFAAFSSLIERVGPSQAPGNTVISVGVAALAAWAMGRSGLAHERMARAREFAARSGNPYDEAMALHFRGLLCACDNDPDAAGPAAEALLVLARANGFGYAVNLAQGMLGWVGGRGGAAQEAAAVAQQASEGLAATGARVGLTFGITLAAEIHARAGDPREAFRAFEKALTINPQERVFRPDTFIRRAALYVQMSRNEAAIADLREAAGLAREMGAKAWELRAQIALGRLTGETASLAELVAADLDTPELEVARGLLAKP